MGVGLFVNWYSKIKTPFESQLYDYRFINEITVDMLLGGGTTSVCVKYSTPISWTDCHKTVIQIGFSFLYANLQSYPNHISLMLIIKFIEMLVIVYLFFPKTLRV